MEIRIWGCNRKEERCNHHGKKDHVHCKVEWVSGGCDTLFLKDEKIEENESYRYSMMKSYGEKYGLHEKISYEYCGDRGPLALIGCDITAAYTE